MSSLGQRSLVPLLLAGISMPALADDALFFADLPVVASVSRLPQRLADAPASVTVIDQAMIRASGIRALNDIFRLVPGFQTFAQSDATSRVNYHGITDDNDFSPRVQVLVDGRSLHSPLFRGGVNWGLLPVALEDIERIEVLRGSNSVSYGTNAFLGVVNIVTVDPSLVRGVSVAARVGTQGVRDHTLRAGGAWREGSYRLTYQEVSDDGLEDGFDWQDSNRVRRLDGRVDQQLTDRDALELNLGRVEGRFTRGRLKCNSRPPYNCGSVGANPGDPIRDLNESSTWIQARWLHTFNSEADFSLRYSFSEDKGDETFVDPSRAPGFQRVNEAGDWGRRHEIEAIHHFSPLTGVRLAWGASWRHDTMKSDTMLRDLGEQSRQVWRVFSNGEWKPSHWITANLGLSNEHDSLAGTHVSPRASLAVHLSPENTVRLGYSRSWRTSSIVAYRANHRIDAKITQNDQIGNPDLPAERLDSWELAFLGDWRDWRMSLDVRHFDERLTDRLILIRPGPEKSVPPTQRSEQSIQDIRMRGYEFQWKWVPLDGTQIMLNHARIRIDSELSGNGERIAGIEGSNLWVFPATDAALRYRPLAERSAPGRSSSVLLTQKLPYDLLFSVAHYRVGSMKWTRNTDVDAYRRSDARLAYPFVLGGKRGELAYTVQSLNGAHVEQRKDGSKPNGRVVDRRQWISVSLNF